MNSLSPTLVWIAGFALSLATIHLTRAWRDWPPSEMEFDRPIERALIAVLGWVVLLMIAIFAVTLDGVIWPGVVGVSIWVLYAMIRRKVSLQRAYRLALPAALIGVICALLLFQAVYGDRSFGLINIFPER